LIARWLEVVVKVGFMAEPSLLCVNCFKPPPEDRAKWQSCVRCAKLKLPATYYCSAECQEAHWPKHQQYHKAQTLKAARCVPAMEQERPFADVMTRHAEQTGDECSKVVAQAMTFMAKGNLHGATKAWRKVIETWPANSVVPLAYENLATTLHRSCRIEEAAQCNLNAMELHEEDTEAWAKAAANACVSLLAEDLQVRMPEWWNDDGLKALSARVVAAAPDYTNACMVRAGALAALYPSCSFQDHLIPGPRTAAELKEAATWFRRAEKSGSGTRSLEVCASECDCRADGMLAEAAEALDATRRAAEDKANAAAEELLAEEEKEKEKTQTQTVAGTTVSKTKQGKGKKKGTR